MSPNILSIKDIKFGDHLCSIYQNKEQQFSFVVPFLMDGLMNNNKCIYVAGENLKEEVIFQFENAGFNVMDYINSHQLEIVIAHDIYLKGGVFIPERLLEIIGNLQDTAIKEGYVGIRGIGEMDLSNNKTIVENLVDYEVKLDAFMKDKKAIVLCQYNENILSHELLNNIIRTHESVVIYGKLYKNKYFYIDPEYFDEAKKLPPDSYKTIIDTIIEE